MENSGILQTPDLPLLYLIIIQNNADGDAGKRWEKTCGIPRRRRPRLWSRTLHAFLIQRLPAPPEIILGYYETDTAVNQSFARGS
jgi:hypothetical protein